MAFNSALLSRFAAAAAQGKLMLPVCNRCGATQYPLRDFCANCLSAEVHFQEVDGGGRLLAMTRLHRSSDARFRPRLPLRIGSIQLDVGPTVIAFLPEDMPQNTSRVQVTADSGSEGAFLSARPADPDPEILLNRNEPHRDLRGKVVLVTGASGGIGAHLVAAFLEAGVAEVIAAGRRATPVTDPRVTPVVLDVTSSASVGALAERVAHRVDILVNNAGVNANQRLLADDAESAARAEMEVNFFGLLRLYEVFAPSMKTRGSGVVVNMLSVLAHANLPLMATYCASKAAALSLTQAMRAELAPFSVRVCSILPPVVDTGMSRHVPAPKLPPAELAGLVIQAIRDGTEDLYPGAAETLRSAWQADGKAIERAFAARLAPPTQP